MSKTIRSVFTRASENTAAISKALGHAGGRSPPICEGTRDQRGDQRLKLREHEFDELRKLEKLKEPFGWDIVPHYHGLNSSTKQVFP